MCGGASSVPMPPANERNLKKVTGFSGDTRAWYERACGYDRAGLERKAEPCYARVYENWRALPKKEQPGFFLGYGSTLRNNRKFSRSLAVLEEGARRFPSYPALKVFLSLVSFDKKDFRKAALLLFSSCLEMPESAWGGYSRAIKFYIGRLPE